MAADAILGYMRRVEVSINMSVPPIQIIQPPNFLIDSIDYNVELKNYKYHHNGNVSSSPVSRTEVGWHHVIFIVFVLMNIQ